MWVGNLLALLGAAWHCCLLSGDLLAHVLQEKSTQYEGVKGQICTLRFERAKYSCQNVNLSSFYEVKRICINRVAHSCFSNENVFLLFQSQSDARVTIVCPSFYP